MGEKENNLIENLETSQFDMKSLIYMVRNQQVMLDSDIARLYQVETKYLNKAMKRNQARFPKEFCFQINGFEYKNLRFHYGTSSLMKNNYGGRRTLPYVFTEQGIAMLSAVLRSDVAVQVSINIMNAFIEMRHFITSNKLLFEHISHIELKQLEYQKQTDEKIEQIFQYISVNEEISQKTFYEGQIYDAYSLLVSLIQGVKKDIVLIDGYVDVKTLNLLSKKKEGVSVTIYTMNHTSLTCGNAENFNAQYPTLKVNYTKAFHDRFLILDKTTIYHIGASIKDAGIKCFGINLIQDVAIIKEMLNRLGM